MENDFYVAGIWKFFGFHDATSSTEWLGGPTQVQENAVYGQTTRLSEFNGLMESWFKYPVDPWEATAGPSWDLLTS
jgi:hypothetical protein